MVTVTKAKKSELEATGRKISGMAGETALNIEYYLDKAIKSYSGLKEVNGFDSRAIEKLKSISDSIKSENTINAISDKASKIMKRTESEYDSKGMGGFNESFGKEISDTEHMMSGAESPAEALKDIVKGSNLMPKEMSESMHGEINGKMDIAANALDTKAKASDVTNAINKINPQEVVKWYTFLKAEDLVLKRLGDISDDFKDGKTDAAMEKMHDNSLSTMMLLLIIQEKKTDQQMQDNEQHDIVAAKTQPQEHSGNNVFSGQNGGNGTALGGAGNSSEINATGTVTKKWLRHAKDYYSHFEVWAEDNISDEKKAEFASKFKELESTMSMKTAIELWKDVNAIWVKNTGVIEDESDREGLLKRTMSVSNAKEAINVSRESLARHVIYYATWEEQDKYGGTKINGLMLQSMPSFKPYIRAYTPEFMKRFHEERKLHDQLDAEHAAGGKEGLQAEIDEIHKDIERDLGYRTDFPSRQTGRFNLRNPGHKLSSGNELINFYNNYINMLETHQKGQQDIRNGKDGDYSGDDMMWKYMYLISWAAYRRRKYKPIEYEEPGSGKASAFNLPPPPPQFSQESTKTFELPLPPPQYDTTS
ncbi:MAG: hypothetical protein ACREBH_02595 [Candidatus Micrarchaeaceae archaeon]